MLTLKIILIDRDRYGANSFKNWIKSKQTFGCRIVDLNTYSNELQLNPALMDFRRPIIFFCYRLLPLSPTKEIKRINLKGSWTYICYRRNSVGGRSVRAEFIIETFFSFLVHHQSFFSFLVHHQKPWTIRVKYVWLKC